MKRSSTHASSYAPGPVDPNLDIDQRFRRKEAIGTIGNQWLIVPELELPHTLPEPELSMEFDLPCRFLRGKKKSSHDLQ